MITDPTDMKARLADLQARAVALQQKFGNPPSFEEPESPVRAEFVPGEGVAIRVSDDWQQRIEPAQLTAAINRAVALALPAPAMPSVVDDPVSVDHVPFDVVETARQVSDLTAPLIQLAVTAAQQARHWTPDAEVVDPEGAVVGVNESRRVQVVLVEGAFRRCDIDSQWADRKSGKAIAMAFADAFADASQHFPSVADRPPASAALGDAATIITYLRGRL